MQLIGMLDSPYVRRTAISLRLLGLAFEHRAISVFTTFQEFHSINPLVKAPSLVCDDGTVLMDSTLIIAYAEHLASGTRTLMPSERTALQNSLRLIGIALAACEKCVQSLYEKSLRPQAKWHQPWLDRVRHQALAGFTALEDELRERPLAAASDTIDQAGLTIAVVWSFTQSLLPDLVVASNYPTLAAHGAHCEALPEFMAFPPDGPGVPTT